MKEAATTFNLGISQLALTLGILDIQKNFNNLLQERRMLIYTIPISDYWAVEQVCCTFHSHCHKNREDYMGYGSQSYG